VGSRNDVLDWSADPSCEGAIYRGKDMPDDTLPRALQKWL